MHHFGQIRTRGTNRWGGELWGLLRLGTDMDSTWLPDEERTCQTHPDEKGRVAIVTCSTSGSRPYHNIPVKFWEGVDRNSVSDWKRRREGDQFVCPGDWPAELPRRNLPIRRQLLRPNLPPVGNAMTPCRATCTTRTVSSLIRHVSRSQERSSTRPMARKRTASVTRRMETPTAGSNWIPGKPACFAHFEAFGVGLFVAGMTFVGLDCKSEGPAPRG